MITKKLTIAALLLLQIIFTAAMAADKGVYNAIELASEQETLSQKIAKNFFYIKKDILTQAAQTELNASLSAYKANRLKIDKLPALKDHADTFILVDFIAEDFLSHAVRGAGASKTASAELLELSEALTEAYHELIVSVEKKAGIAAGSYVDRLDRQPMQIERLAKYYVAYIAGFSDKSTADALKKAVQAFDKDMVFLVKNSSGSAEIDKELKRVSGWWRTMKKYYLSVEKQQLPAVVLATTNKILKSMEKVALIYAQVHESKK